MKKILFSTDLSLGQRSVRLLIFCPNEARQPVQQMFRNSCQKELLSSVFVKLDID